MTENPKTDGETAATPTDDRKTVFVRFFLAAKVVATIVFVSIPLIFLPSDRLVAFGVPASNEVFRRLLGVAYIALCVIYGLAWCLGPKWDGWCAALIAGVVSNGGACLVLLMSGLCGGWDDWGAAARSVMWGATVATGLLAMLMLWGLRGTSPKKLKDPKAPRDTTLEENKYKADVEVHDRYTQFSAEIARVSLAALGAFGLILGWLWKAPTEAKAGAAVIQNVLTPCWMRYILFADLAAFGLAIAFALWHRYLAADGMACHIAALRYQSDSDKDQYWDEIKLRNKALRMATCILGLAAFFLVIGAGLFCVFLISAIHMGLAGPTSCRLLAGL